MAPVTISPFADTSPAAIALLKVVSFLNPNGIKKNMLINAINKLHVRDYPKNIDELTTALDELDDSQRFFRDPRANDLSISDVLQESVQANLDNTEWTSIFKDVVNLLSEFWPFTEFKNRNLTARWATYKTYVPHCAQLRNLLQEKLKLGNIDVGIETAELFNDAACYMCEIAAYDEIELYAQASLEVLDKIALNAQTEGEHRIEDIRISNELGIAISAQGTGDGAKALEHTTTAIDIAKGFIEDDPKNGSLTLAICYNNLGIVNNILGSVELSIAAWTTSSNHFLNREGSTYLDATWPAVNTALVNLHQDEVHMAAMAIAPVSKALDETRGYNDMSSSESGAILRAMGHLRVAQKKTPPALEFHRLALLNLRATLGDKHFQTADCMYNVAQDHLRMKFEVNKREASKLLDEAIAVWGNNPWYKRSAARALWRKGRLLREFGKDDEAEEFLSKAMDIRKTIAPDDKRDETELKETDWTELINFYSR